MGDIFGSAVAFYFPATLKVNFFFFTKHVFTLARLSCPVCLSLQGTTLFYQPGLLSGGPVEHDCNTQRSIGYYLEALLMLAPFMKNPLKATLRGVTNDPCDPTVWGVLEFRL